MDKEQYFEEGEPETASFQSFEPNDESLEAIREAEELIEKGDPGYASAAEMFAAMGL